MVDFKSKPVPMPQLKIENKAVPMPKLNIKDKSVPMPEFPTKYRTLPKKDKLTPTKFEQQLKQHGLPSSKEVLETYSGAGTLKIVRKGMQLVNRGINAVSNKIEKQAIKSSLKVKKGENPSTGVRDRIIENRLPSDVRNRKILKSYESVSPKKTLDAQKTGGLPTKEGRLKVYGMNLPATKGTFKKDLNMMFNKVANNPKNYHAGASKVLRQEQNVVRQAGALSAKEVMNPVNLTNKAVEKGIKKYNRIRKIERKLKSTTIKGTALVGGAMIGTNFIGPNKKTYTSPQPSYMKKVKNKEFLK